MEKGPEGGRGAPEGSRKESGGEDLTLGATACGFVGAVSQIMQLMMGVMTVQNKQTSDEHALIDSVAQL